MKTQVEKILLNVINDFNSKWTSHAEKDAGVSEYAEQIIKLFSQADVIGTLPLHKVEGLIKALTDIKDWDDDLEDEWEDQGYRAIAALKEWTS